MFRALTEVSQSNPARKQAEIIRYPFVIMRMEAFGCPSGKQARQFGCSFPVITNSFAQEKK